MPAGRANRLRRCLLLIPVFCKTGIFPLGHPEIITENFSTLEDYPVSVIKCKVLPPRGLYHPVLPYRHDGKISFPLCRTCAEEQSDSCAHTDEQRSLYGAWVCFELQIAIKLGYKVIFLDICNFSFLKLYFHRLPKPTKSGTTRKARSTTRKQEPSACLPNTSTSFFG